MWLIPPIAWLSLQMPWNLVAAALVVGSFFVLFRRDLAKRIGGATGDCLGCLSYFGQLILQAPLDDTLQGTGAKHRVISFVRQPFFCPIVQLDLDLPTCQALFNNRS